MLRHMVLGVVVSMSAAAWGQVATPCASLVSLKLNAATITSAAVVTAESVPEEWKIPPARVRELKSFCRVQILDTPSADSSIHTEVWLPVAGWNGTLSTRGNGGFAGQIYYAQMAAAVAVNDATADTDAGHPTTLPDFALGHPEKVKDFGWRAVHDMTVQAKAVVAAFYGKPQTHAYFAACSDGGREALMEAQRFPADYDGILAGAPAYDWTHLLAGSGADLQALTATPESYIPASKLPAIGAAVRAACDANDGVMDGVLNDPRTCKFDPATLVCKNGDSDSCLLPQQVVALKGIYSPKVDDKGKTIYSGYTYGAEDAPGAWAPWKLGQKAEDSTLMGFFVLGDFRDFVYQDPNWQISSFHLGAAAKMADEKTGADLNATNPDLRAFTGRGGRLILYHGWNDPAIPAPGTIAYYEAVRSKIGAQSTDSAVRLYMVPGMLHCGGGPGATDFGQNSDGKRGDAQHDVMLSLEQWVETGKAPGTLIAKSPTKAMTRPLCVYPAEAKYVAGDADRAESFVCTAAAR